MMHGQTQIKLIKYLKVIHVTVLYSTIEGGVLLRGWLLARIHIYEREDGIWLEEWFRNTTIYIKI